MTQRLTTVEIEDLLRIGLERGVAKRFRGSSPYTVTVSFEEGSQGRHGRAAVIQAGAEREVMTMDSPEDLRSLADRVESLVYPDTERR